MKTLLAIMAAAASISLTSVSYAQTWASWSNP